MTHAGGQTGGRGSLITSEHERQGHSTRPLHDSSHPFAINLAHLRPFTLSLYGLYSGSICPEGPHATDLSPVVVVVGVEPHSNLSTACRNKVKATEVGGAAHVSLMSVERGSGQLFVRVG